MSRCSRMRWTVMGFALVLTASAGCIGGTTERETGTRLEGELCDLNADCVGGFICRNEVCRLLCTGDTDCQMLTHHCEEGVCLPGTSIACGNGRVEVGEGCDDGDQLPDDGCSTTCTEEQDWSCSGSPSACQRCADGVLQGNEQCDDGGEVPGDGCDAGCAEEAGWSCDGEPSSCAAVCGDSQILGAEACDDGGTAVNDGCDAACAEESGWNCVGQPSSCSTTCGDSVVAGTETCDDAGTTPGDGCDSACAVEANYFCSGEPSSCVCDTGFQDNDVDGSCMPGCTHPSACAAAPGAQCDDGSGANVCACPSYTGGVNCGECVVYVSAQGTPSGLGASWADATSGLQSGINIAASYAIGIGDICQVWVSAGNYQTPIDLASSVHIYGGFRGTELLVDDREDLLGTVLDGNGRAGRIMDARDIADVRLDGLVLRDATADGASLSVNGWAGALLAERVADLILKNVVVADNVGRGHAGGLLLYDSVVTVEDCLFVRNRARRDFGGAILVDGGNLTVRRSFFLGNIAETSGASIALVSVLGGVPPATVMVSGSLFIGESVESGGDGMLYAEAGSQLTIERSTLTGNDGGGPGIITGDGTVIVHASILWNPAMPAEVAVGGPGASVTYSNVNGSFIGQGNIDRDPAFLVGTSGNWSVSARVSSDGALFDLTDSGAAWTPGAWVGALVEGQDPLPSQGARHLLPIVANSSTTVTVIAAGNPPFGGGTYSIIDARLSSGSPCIDTVPQASLSFDEDVDGGPSVCTRGGDPLLCSDMGAYEYR